MKLKEIEVGQSYRRSRGRYRSDDIVYVLDTGWKRRNGHFVERFVRGGSGVAVARRSGNSWFPDVVPLGHIAEPMTEEQLKERQDAVVASLQRNRERGERQEAEVKAAAERLSALGVPAFVSGYGQGAVVSIRHADLPKLEALIAGRSDDGQ